ncbi:MAG TPA: hypothetical protein VJP79_11715 [Nitrososphaera sp.]|nr:hypothetical protein [Nitrososphaera sp.]
MTLTYETIEQVTEKRQFSDFKYNVSRRLKRRYVCNGCKMYFEGSGSALTARQHASDFGHAISQNGKICRFKTLQILPARNMTSLNDSNH